MIGLTLGISIAGFPIFLWHPVCVPIADEESPLFERRTDERIWGIQTFQKKGPHWYQCKPWLARQMFF